MNQRGKKDKIFSSKDLISQASKNNCSLEYILELSCNKSLEKCKELRDKWNIPLKNREDLTYEEMLNIIWYIVCLYCLQDTRIPYQVIEQQALTFMLREQSSTFSVDIVDVLMRGQVFTTTSSQYRYNYQYGFMMDFGDQGGPVEPFGYGGGYVGKGEPGLKITDDDSVMFVIDFASLYPTIIIAHNLCYTTWVANDMRDHKSKDYIWLKYEQLIPIRIEQLRKELSTLSDTDMEDEIQKRRAYYLEQIDISILKRKQYQGQSYGDKIDRILMYIAELEVILSVPYEKKGVYMCSIFDVPNKDTGCIHTHWFLRASVLPGVVPVMLWEDYLTRKIVKGKMGVAFKRGDISIGITYNAQQTGIKLKMNATYGGFGTSTNRLANFPAAETITYIGRECIHLVNAETERGGYGKVVYNDTDSAMVLVNDITKRFNRDIQLIKQHGENAAKELGNIFPKPMGLECENFFVSFFLRGPKMYAAIKWDEKSVDIRDYTHDYVNAMKLLYVKGMTPVRRDKYTYSKELFMEALYHILARRGSDVLGELIEYVLPRMWNLTKGIQRGNKTEQQWKAYLSNIERLFAYNMGVTPKALQGGNGTMARWCNIYAHKYGVKPIAGERFELFVTNVSSGPDKDKHTKSPSKLVTMEWMFEEGRQLDIEHYLLQLSNDGNLIELMHIAYPNDVPRDCMQKYYIPKLKRDGHLN